MEDVLIALVCGTIIRAILGDLTPKCAHLSTEICTESPEHQGFLDVKCPHSSSLWNCYWRGFGGFYP